MKKTLLIFTIFSLILCNLLIAQNITPEDPEYDRLKAEGKIPPR